MINKTCQLIIIITFWLSNGFAQKLIYTGDFHLIGYSNNEPVFRLYNKRSNLNSLYKIKKENNYYNYGFYSYQTNQFPSNEVEFINNNTLIRRFKENGIFKNIIYHNTDSLEIKNWTIENSIFIDDKILLIFLSKEFSYITAKIDFNLSEPQVSYIPIKADRAYIVDDWLYFSFFHVQTQYSPFPHDIFRVKIGDWYNPELIFEASEYDEWFLYPEHHVLGTDIELNMLVSNEKSNESEILYNVETKSYAIIPNLYSKKILRYAGGYYTFFKQRDNTRGVETIGLKALPELSKEYPYTEHEVLPREVWYNIPLKEKTFEGTFITPYLLREAPRKELLSLGNSQLRLLRNAIYAQYGYIFRSNDLKEFYGQFNWYRMMTAKKVDNEDVILLPKDKERTELIREVENTKN